jgi:hypothetical protein
VPSREPTIPPENSTSKSVLFSLFGEQITKPIKQSGLFPISELSRIKEDSITNRARLVPNMRLSRVNHPDHLGMTFGAMNVSEFIKPLASLRVSDVNLFGALYCLELGLFLRVKPEPLALGTAINLDGLKGHDFKEGVTFGTIHGNVIDNGELIVKNDRAGQTMEDELRTLSIFNDPLLS